MLFEIAVAIITINSTVFTVKKLYNYFNQPEEYCVVCFTKCDDSISCGHYVHYNCIAQWGKNECPLCRRSGVLPEMATPLIEYHNLKKRYK